MIILYDDETKKTSETSGLAKALEERMGQPVPAHCLTELEVMIEVGQPVSITVGGRDLADFGPVYFRTISRARDLAAIAADHLKTRGITFIDDEALPNISIGKIHQMYLLHKNNFLIPDTFTGSHHFISSLIGTKLTLPFIYKANIASKGNDNYLISSVAEFDDISTKNPLKRFIAQTYIQNSSDYRLLVFGDAVGLIVERQRTGGTHMNNTSQGATARLVKPGEIAESVRAAAVKAARLKRRDVAGVDIIINSAGQPVILEVNRTPQLATGSFVDEKLDRFISYISSL